jgi:hypothetical protein
MCYRSTARCSISLELTDVRQAVLVWFEECSSVTDFEHARSQSRKVIICRPLMYAGQVKIVPQLCRTSIRLPPLTIKYSRE